MPGPGEFSLLWSVLVPGVVLAVSVGVTFALYRHFSRRL